MASKSFVLTDRDSNDRVVDSNELYQKLCNECGESKARKILLDVELYGIVEHKSLVIKKHV
jgi:hypothetical protein